MHQVEWAVARHLLSTFSGPSYGGKIGQNYRVLSMDDCIEAGEEEKRHLPLGCLYSKSLRVPAANPFSSHFFSMHWKLKSFIFCTMFSSFWMFFWTSVSVPNPELDPDPVWTVINLPPGSGLGSINSKLRFPDPDSDSDPYYLSKIWRTKNKFNVSSFSLIYFLYDNILFSLGPKMSR